MGALLTSDLLTRWAAADNRPQFLALESVPTTATSLLASLELYPATPDPLTQDLAVLLELLNADEATIARQSAALSTVAGIVHADGVFRLQGVPIGSYTLRATVSRASQVLG